MPICPKTYLQTLVGSSHHGLQLRRVYRKMPQRMGAKTTKAFSEKHASTGDYKEQRILAQTDLRRMNALKRQTHLTAAQSLIKSWK